MKALTLAAVLFAPVALSQQVAAITSCTSVLDGGATGACGGSFQTNYQPLGGVCTVTVPGASSAGVTIQILVSPDGFSFAPVSDAGITIVQNGAGSASASFSISPTDPWLAAKLATTGTAIDGGTGSVACTVGVIQTQTLHAVKPRK